MLYSMILIGLMAFVVSKDMTPPNVNIGMFVDMFTNNGELNSTGSFILAAMNMAINEINNKSDGLYDYILPKTKLNFALREMHGDYLATSVVARELSVKAFNGTGVVGVVGTGYELSSKSVATTYSYTKFKVVLVDYYSSSTDFSHSTDYPYYVRVVPSVAYTGRAMARLASQNFGITKANLFYTADAYGTDTAAEFLDDASIFGIEIENKHSFWPGTTDFSSIISRTLSYGILKVFVLIMAPEDAGRLLEAGYNAGLFREGTQIFGTDEFLTPRTWGAMSSTAPVDKIMKGAISMMYYPTIDSPMYPSFMKRFLKQPSTKTTLKNGTIICSHARDDDNSTYLYLNTKSSDCAGIDFKSLPRDGSTIPPIAAYAYDAVYTLALGIHSAIDVEKKSFFTGDDLMNSTLSGVNFPGATGNIDLADGIGENALYGKGDRQKGNRYYVYNYNPSYGNSSNAVRRIGAWRKALTSILLCDKSKDKLCSDPVYNTKTNDPVRSEPDVVEVVLEKWARALLAILGCIGLFIVFFYCIVWLVFSDTKLVKVTQPLIMFVVLVGGMLGGVQIFLNAMEISDTVCVASMWVGHLSFAIVFAALLARTWRIGKIVNSGFQKASVSANQMYVFMVCGLAIFCAILIVDTRIGRPHRSYKESFNGHQLIRLIKCQNEEQTISTVLFCLEAAMLLYGAKLCYDAKDAPGSVNDSASISLAQYLILFVCAATFPIVFFSIDPTPQNLTLVMASGYFICLVGVLNIVFGFKTILILEGAEVDTSLNVVRARTFGKHSKLTFMANTLSSKMKERIRNSSDSREHKNTRSRENKGTTAAEKKASAGEKKASASVSTSKVANVQPFRDLPTSVVKVDNREKILSTS